jgi:hypothetical protein
MSLNMNVFKEYLVLKRNIGLAERDILALVYMYYVELPSVQGFRDSC